MWARLWLCCAALAGLARGGDYTALDRYVAAPDASYRYSLVRTQSGAGYTIYQLDLVSQTWLTAADVDRTEWHHWVTILKPDQPATQTALLVVDGGSNSTALPDSSSLVPFALLAGSVVIDLGQVPNQPLTFAGEKQPRTEDALIAYTWNQYLRTGDERWPARLPMTKAVVRAMDAVTEFLAKLPTGPMTIRNFVVMGASKRGWTTWTTAIVDPRVIAIAPMVIDTLSMEECFVHTWRVYGFWPPAVQDYVSAGIFDWFGTPQIQGLEEIEDPYRYRERLTLPKYMVNAGGDQFFLPDNSQFAFSNLPGEKYLRYVPNTDHSLASSDALLGLLGWYRAVIGNAPRPRFYWKADRAKGTLRVRVLDQPSKVVLWQASNRKARDFRLETIGPAWTGTPVTGENGIYDVALPAPAEGFTAFFVELTYPGELALIFTTEVVVMPDVYPFAPPPSKQ